MDIKKIIPNFLVFRIIVKIIANITRVTTSPIEVIASITFVVNDVFVNNPSKEMVMKLSKFTIRSSFINKDNNKNEKTTYKKLKDLIFSTHNYKKRSNLFHNHKQIVNPKYLDFIICIWMTKMFHDLSDILGSLKVLSHDRMQFLFYLNLEYLSILYLWHHRLL